jgi:hypothetical protein
MGNSIYVNTIKRIGSNTQLYPIVATMYYNQVANQLKSIESGTIGISSVTDDSAGLYTPSFTIPYTAANSYICTGAAAENAGDQPGNMIVIPRTTTSGLFNKTTSSCSLVTENIDSGGTKQRVDTYHIHVCFVGTVI